MELGLLIPQGYFNDFDGWEPRRAWERMVEIARLGERLGFGSIWMGEHVVAKWAPRDAGVRRGDGDDGAGRRSSRGSSSASSSSTRRSATRR